MVVPDVIVFENVVKLDRERVGNGKRGYRKPSPVGRMSGFGWLQGVGLLSRLPNGNRTLVTAAGGAVASFEVSARAQSVLNFSPAARRRG